MNWFVYIIEDDRGHWYTGITTDIERRWHQHAELKTGAKYFRGRVPVALKYMESFENRSLASKREYVIKQMTRSQKETLIQNAQSLPEFIHL